MAGIGSLFGWAGIGPDTDRALGDLDEAQAALSKQYDSDMAGVFSAYDRAAGKYKINNNLDDYNTQMQNVVGPDGTQSQAANAFGSMNTNEQGALGQVDDYMNPYMNQMENEAMRKVQGGAGAAIQSGHTARQAAGAVAGVGGQAWKDSLGAAQSGIDSANQAKATQGAGFNQVGATTADIYNQQLGNKNAPAEQLAALKADSATAKLNAGTAAANAKAQVSASEPSLIGRII